MPPAAAGGAKQQQQQQQQQQFMSVANFKVVEGVFRAYMRDKHGVRIEAEGEGAARAKRALFRVMEDLQRRQDQGELAGAAPRLKDMNNLALNAARDVLMREREREAQPQPQPQARLNQAPTAAERDREVFGERRVVSFQMVPSTADGNGALAPRAELSRSFDSVSAARRAEAAPPAPPRPPWEAGAAGEAVEAMGQDEFQERLARLEGEREAERARQAQAARDVLPPPPGAQDAAAVQRAAMRDAEEFRELQARMGAAAAAEPIGNERARALIAPPARARRALVERYIAINGVDRDCGADPLRFRFGVSVRGYDSGDLSQAHTDIEWIEPSCVVVPMEAALPAGADRGFHEHGFGLAYPYLVLSIDGFEGTYDGTNDVARRAFCMLKYRRSYRAPNGRGYVQLEPMQGERRTFAPAPLASLRSLRVALQRPNGALFNNSSDRLRAVTLEYDPVERLYLTLVLDRFYDANEFVPGDLVNVAGFRSRGPPGWDDPDAFAALDAFVNRPEGHEVVRVPPSNEQGFSRRLVVLAPGVLDQGAGVVVVDGRVVRAAQQLADASAPATAESPGRVVNASLQCVVSLQRGERAGDAAPGYAA